MLSFLTSATRQDDEPSVENTKRQHHITGAMMMDSNPDTTPRKGLLGSLLRRGSLIRKRPKTVQRNSRRASDGDPSAARRDRRRSYPTEEAGAGAGAGAVGARDSGATVAEPPTSLRPRRQDPELQQEPLPDPDWETEPEVPKSRKSRGKQRVDVNGHRTPSPSPLTEWPPGRMSIREELTEAQATQLICRGVPIHKGHRRSIPHASASHFALYCTTSEDRGDEHDGVNLHDSMTQLMTMRMLSPSRATYPWETLEQPSYTFYYGQLPGTITLNQWASMVSVFPSTIALKDSGVIPRPMSLEKIFDRLQELKPGLEDDDPDLLYKILYRRILRDPDRILSPHKTLDKQITDLILVLSRPDWIDFANPKNQVVTRFIFESQQENFAEQYQKFFHQLLLSLELELRIQSSQHKDWAKEKLLQQIPPSIQWNLALARRWWQYVRVDDFGKTPDQIELRYKLKKRQVKMLRRFATMMKWPNLTETLENLRQKDSELALDAVSSDSFAFFSGLIVPGPTFPFLIMNTLIDMDPDPATDDLALLSHIHPNCGFQYRSSYTYWSAQCIVGKVLAPTCRSVAGWVGPARPTPDLTRSQIARIRTRRPVQVLKPEDVESMAQRSEPLGPESDIYPVDEYVLELPDPEDIIDTVRVETLGLRVAAAAVSLEDKNPRPRVFDATVQFAIDGVSWPLRLMYDVSFISAWPCSEGPHPLFFDYVYTRTRADEIVNIHDWGGLYGRHQSRASSRHGDHGPGGGPAAVAKDEEEPHDEERVLVVDAFGVPDNEVLARAWCAHWGLSAVVADLRKTCFACAVREAYAAAITVVILIEGQQYDDNE